MKNSVIGLYKNGNYTVILYEDGSKVRYNNEDTLTPSFPESIDCKISNRCDIGCLFCHENSTPSGDLADLNAPFFESLHPFTELALGGGNVFEHPGLEDFLARMAAKKIICNVTVHLHHFKQYYDTIKEYAEKGYIHGIGISINSNINDEELALISSLPNIVVHCIAGVVPYSTLVKMAYHNIKLLFLGYKTFGRGTMYGKQHDSDILNNIVYIVTHMKELQEWFPVISFDNLAIKQLHVKDIVDPKTWEKIYMGDDGQYTMYIDAVKMEYAISSTSPRKPIGEENDIIKLFNNCRT